MVPQNQSVLIVPSNRPYDDDMCRQLIAAETGTAVLDRDADRCCVLDSNHTVIAVHKRDPIILPATDLEHRLMLHPSAEIGDVWDGAVFQRRPP
jgi:hypothetical protein